MKSKKSIVSFMAIVGLSSAYAQESVNASGGNATGSGGTISYSVGQVAYTSNSSNTGSVAQGVQHAYEIFTLGVEETALNISLTAFPNPTMENLTLQITDFNNEKLSYQLYDMQGKQLIQGEVIANKTEINTSSLPPATYFINVVNQENKTVQSFKIVKK
jgi:opacity protein-like surface antigen